MSEVYIIPTEHKRMRTMGEFYIGEAKVPLNKEQLVSFVNMCDGHSLFDAKAAVEETGAELGAFVSLSETIHNTKETDGQKGALFDPDGNEVDSIENSIYGLSALRAIAGQLEIEPSEMIGRGFEARDLQVKILKKIATGYSNVFDASEWVGWFDGIMDSLKVGGVWATTPDYLSPFILEKVSHPDPSRPNGKPRTTAGRVRVKSGELDERTAAVIEASWAYTLEIIGEDTDDDSE